VRIAALAIKTATRKLARARSIATMHPSPVPSNIPACKPVSQVCAAFRAALLLALLHHTHSAFHPRLHPYQQQPQHIFAQLVARHHAALPDIAPSDASDSVPQVGIARHHASPSPRIAAGTSCCYCAALRSITWHRTAPHSSILARHCTASQPCRGIAHRLAGHCTISPPSTALRNHTSAQHRATSFLRSIAQQCSIAYLRLFF
jgi:hypothetical protein